MILAEVFPLLLFTIFAIILDLLDGLLTYFGEPLLRLLASEILLGLVNEVEKWYYLKNLS